MATYKEVKGATIQTLDSDPVVGGVAGGSWSSGTNMPLARDSHAGFGVKTANGVVGGRTTPGPAPALTTGVNTYIEYDGSSWTEKANINQQRWLAEGAGVVTSAIIFSGAYPASNNLLTNVETWDGSSWSEVSEINVGRRSLGGAGIVSTSALAFGGRASTYYTNTESWDGSSWTEVNEMNTARAYNVGSGLVTSAIYAGGSNGSSVANVETWDGTNWTEVAEMNTTRHSLSSSGNSTDALAFSGRTSPPGTNRTNTEAWNGSAWTEVADVATARYDSNAGGAPGSSTSAIMTGGYGTAYSAATEEWAIAPVTAAILTEGSIFLSGGTTLKGFGKAAGIPAATWATGGDMNVSSHARGGAGHSNTAALAIGADPSPKGQTELYNGTTWTELNDLNVGRRYMATFGTTTAAIGAGGSPGSGYSAKAESWEELVGLRYQT